MNTDGLTLVEECTGSGTLESGGQRSLPVRYEIRRFQGITASGLPVPGLHRIEGQVEPLTSDSLEAMVGVGVTLRLDDGRALGVTVASAHGRVLTEGHGPSRCHCC